MHASTRRGRTKLARGTSPVSEDNHHSEFLDQDCIQPAAGLQLKIAREMVDISSKHSLRRTTQKIHCDCFQSRHAFQGGFP